MSDSVENANASETENKTPVIGRNEPCPCGSGKKYKRCHGVDAAPILNAPKTPLMSQDMPFDPSQMDPAFMQQMTQMLSQMPKGQLQRMQGLMQKAMAGKDVSKEVAEFEKTLPKNFHDLMANSNLPDLKELEEKASSDEANPDKKNSRWGKFWRGISGKKA